MRTVLFDRHQSLSAKIVDFAGWEMPIQYKGIIHEHHAVRKSVGVFDVSHMGRILIQGSDAERFLDYISTNKISGKKPGSATYTVWATEEGGCVDDVIVYRLDETRFFVVVNASNRAKDLNHLQKHAHNFDAEVISRYDEDGILAIQGPKAIEVVSKIIPELTDMKPMRVQEKGDLSFATTGYTGAGGCEIYAPKQKILELWDQLFDIGKEYGIEPIGLGARDTLRLEMGYALYGHEIDEAINPMESVSSWTVKLAKENFIGKKAIEKKKEEGVLRSEFGVVLKEKGIAREGYEVLKNGKTIGNVTSGTHSPTLNKAIAIVIADCKVEEGETVEVQIRNNRCQAEVVALPFLKG